MEKRGLKYSKRFYICNQDNKLKESVKNNLKQSKYGIAKKVNKMRDPVIEISKNVSQIIKRNKRENMRIRETTFDLEIQRNKIGYYQSNRGRGRGADRTRKEETHWLLSRMNERAL